MRWIPKKSRRKKGVRKEPRKGVRKEPRKGVAKTSPLRPKAVSAF
jgi:hypothetical protein